MRPREWAALAVFVGAAYWLMKSKGSSGGTPLDIQSGPGIVGFIDATQKVQYDPSTGNLWDVSGATNTLIATIQAGGDATVFLQPSVQSLITAAIAARTG